MGLLHTARAVGSKNVVTRSPFLKRFSDPTRFGLQTPIQAKFYNVSHSPFSHQPACGTPHMANARRWG